MDDFFTVEEEDAKEAAKRPALRGMPLADRVAAQRAFIEAVAAVASGSDPA